MKVLLLVTLLFLASMASAQRGPVICIDPGHPSEVGRGTHGKRLTEVHVVWEVALLLKQKLQADGYQVVLTKRSEEQVVKNRRRAEIANNAHAALLLRLHCDAEGGRGFGTYYPSQQGSTQGMVGPSSEVLERSHAVAGPFHAAAAMSLKGLVPDRGLKTDLATAIGGKQGALTGSIFSEVPVLLVEMLVLTNPKDEAVALKPGGLDRLAEALRVGVHAAVPLRQQATSALDRFH